MHSTTDRNAPAEPDLVIAKSYQHVLPEYRLHPEHKFHGPDRQQCQRLTRGVLQRRPIHLLGTPRLIGKEANELDEVQAGLHANLNEVLNEYSYPNDALLYDLVLPVLERFSGRQLGELAGSDRRTIDQIRRGTSPRKDLSLKLLTLAAEVAERDLGHASRTPADRRSERLGPGVVFLAAWRRRQQLTGGWRRATLTSIARRRSTRDTARS